jgi:hypothetical protein
VRNKLPIVLYLWFYVGWFACLWCALNNASLLSLIAPVISWVLLHQIWPLNSRWLIYMLSIFALGIGFDIALVECGIVGITPPYVGLAPAWLVSMWFLYVSVLPLTTPMFEQRLWLAAVMGAIMGPLSYKYGTVSGALVFHHEWTIYYYAAFWAAFFPFSVYAKRKLL